MLLPAQADHIPDVQLLANQVWERCLIIIKDQVSSLSYKTWFQPIVPLRLNDKDLTVQVPSQFFYDWLEEHYNTLIRNTITTVIGESGKLYYFIASEEPVSTQQAQPEHNAVLPITDSTRTPFAPTCASSNRKSSICSEQFKSTLFVR